MKVCAVEDCERPMHARGWCNLHWQRWKRSGTTQFQRPSAAERFWARVRKDDPNGCWVWTSTMTPAGYGLISANNMPRLAHRWAYESLVREIPSGLHLDHLCRNRACVNPQHLDVVTPRENVMRGMSPTAVIRRQGICKHGHAMVGENIYVPPGKPQHQQCRTCRKRRSAAAYARKAAA